MNERIKELAEKTGFVHEWMTVGERNDKLKMFEEIAQLIVGECIQSVENTIQTNCETDREKIGCEFAISDLIQHFGIEE